jgi:predicted HNH restriction endonuclease
MANHFVPATVEKYEQVLSASKSEISAKQLEMLRAQYASPGRTATATDLADDIGYQHFLPVNSLYGRLGHLLSDKLGRSPETENEQYDHWWAVISTGALKENGFFEWTMHQQFAEALENLAWVDPGEQLLPEEVPEVEAASLREGAVRQVKVNAYERSTAARRQCITHYGTKCYVCGFDFAERYGEAGEGFIHVHHEKPLSVAEREQEVDPIADLKPVCPNCHGIIHRRTPPYTIEETQQMLR